MRNKAISKLSRPIYLDFNATMPMEQSVLDTLLFFCKSGNPSSIHSIGREAKKIVDRAREQVASILKIENPEEICFTGSATEAINMALKGAFFQEKDEGKKFHLIYSAVEHEATLETARFLKKQGAELHELKVNEDGMLFLDEIEELLQNLSADANNFLFLSTMAANNETGILFPYKKLSEIAHKYGALVHLDAVQALGKIENFSIPDSNADLVSISAHKIGGPMGVGALYVKRGTKLQSLIHGGAQERKRRAGTLNVAGIAAFGIAAEALKNRNISSITSLRMFLERSVREQIPGAHIHGEQTERIANTSNFLFDDVRGEGLLMGLDMAGFAVSSGSACNSGSIGPSHVLLAMGRNKQDAASAIRVSIGPTTTEEEIILFVDALVEVVSRIREQNIDRKRRKG